MSDHAFQAPDPEHLAKLLPQYDIEFFIAQGGMGAVYKGRQRSLDRDVAIKVLPHEVGRNAEFRESFDSEAKSMAKLNHPNLLGVFDFGTVEGMPYIVMEYVEGGSLYQASLNQAVEPGQAAAIVKSICDGLAHAHEHNIVHRDIKPANILLTSAAVPKVADFGLAQALDSDKPGLVMGTPGYTAPEVFQDPGQAGKLADIYSVGVILHQLLTGIDPSGSMEPPSTASGRIRLDAIWRKATHPDPSQRHPSVAAMAQELGKWLDSRPKALGGTGVPAPYRGPARRAQPVTSGGEDGSGLLFKLIIIAVLGILAFFTYRILKEPDGETQVANIEDSKEPDAPVIETPPVDEGVQEEGAGQATDLSATPTLPERDLARNVNPEEPAVPVEPVVPDEVAEVADVEGKPETDLPPGDSELREKAVTLITDAFRKRDTALAENARGFQFQLSGHGRAAGADDARALENLGRQTVDGRIPPANVVPSIPENAREDYRRAVEKEEAIDGENLSALTRIRDAYVTRLAGAAGETDDAELRKRLLAQAEVAKDLDSWIRLLVPDAGPITGAASSRFTVVTNGGFEADAGGTAGASGWEIEPGHFWTSDGKVTDALDPESGANGTGKFLSPNRLAGDAPSSTNSSFARQTIDLSNFSKDIDNGILSLNLGFSYCNGNLRGEASEVSVEFLDEGGTALDSATTGILAQTESNGWAQSSLVAAVPKGARSFIVTLNMRRLTGTTTNGGFDEVSVALEKVP